MQLHTRQTVRFSVVALGLVLLVAGTGLAQSSNSDMGTWKLNLAKSKYEPGPLPASDTRVYEVWEKDGVKATMTVVVDGKSTTRGYAAHYDGKQYPYTGNPEYDTVALKRIDAHTVQGTNSKGGKVVLTTQTVISADGKTRTQTATGVNLKGQKVHNVQVYDKQ